MECRLKPLRHSLLAVEHGLLMLLTVAILLMGIPSYIDVGGAVQISYYFLAPLLVILLVLLLGIIVLDSRKQGFKKPKLGRPQLLLLVVVFGLPLIFSCKVIQEHKSSWKLLSEAWTELGDLNQTELLSSWQEKVNCCGVMGPYDYLNKGLDLPESCFYFTENEQKVNDGCYKVFMDDAFIIHFINVVIFTLYLTVKISRNLLEWKADVSNEKRRTSDSPLLFRQQIND